jgi:hypothetical protein
MRKATELVILETVNTLVNEYVENGNVLALRYAEKMTTAYKEIFDNKDARDRRSETVKAVTEAGFVWTRRA